MSERAPKPVVWIGSSRRDIQEFPKPVRATVGQALFTAQLGGKHRAAKPLLGFGGAGVLEIVEDYAGDTYRAVYTVRLGTMVYVLHAFQKKSSRGRETSRHDVELIRARLRDAEAAHAAMLEAEKEASDE